MKRAHTMWWIYLIAKVRTCVSRLINLHHIIYFYLSQLEYHFEMYDKIKECNSGYSIYIYMCFSTVSVYILASSKPIIVTASLNFKNRPPKITFCIDLIMQFFTFCLCSPSSKHKCCGGAFEKRFVLQF